MTSEQTILVVDDDAKIRALLRRVLEGEGFAVVEAVAASEVMDALDTQHVSLITLDLHLGSEDGVQVALARYANTRTYL